MKLSTMDAYRFHNATVCVLISENYPRRSDNRKLKCPNPPDNQNATPCSMITTRVSCLLIVLQLPSVYKVIKFYRIHCLLESLDLFHTCLLLLYDVSITANSVLNIRQVNSRPHNSISECLNLKSI